MEILTIISVCLNIKESAFVALAYGHRASLSEIVLNEYIYNLIMCSRLMNLHLSGAELYVAYVMVTVKQVTRFQNNIFHVQKSPSKNLDYIALTKETRLD
jgi:hypothetical protein